MTEHDPMDAFETRLTALVRSYTEPAAKPIDPLVTARTAMASSTRERRPRAAVAGRPRPARGLAARPGGPRHDHGGARRRRRFPVRRSFVQAPDGPARIVFVRDGDLFVAEIDGSGQTLIASGDADDAKLGYLTAAWSPDMRHIAAVRDVGGAFLTPGVDLMTADGALVRTVALDPGCGPSLSWSPDSSEVAIATCPADVPRDTDRTGRIQGSGSSSPGWMPPLTGRSRCHPSGGQSRARDPRSGSVRNCGRGGRPTVGGSRFGRPSRGKADGIWWPPTGRAPAGSKSSPPTCSASISLTGHPMGAASRSPATGSAAWRASASGSSIPKVGP